LALPFVSNELWLLACAGFWVLLTLSDDANTKLTHFTDLLGNCHNSSSFITCEVAAFTGWTKLTLYLLLFALSARVLRSPLPQVLGNYISMWR